MNRFSRILLTACGWVSLGLGCIGFFLPLLPTTPFLLLAAACFFRSSDRLYLRLIKHRILGWHILAYREFHAVSMKTKIASFCLLWVTIGSTGVFFVSHVLARVVLACVAVLVSLHLLMMKKMTMEMNQKVTVRMRELFNTDNP